MILDKLRRMFLRAVYTLTGGRPMTFIGSGFYDPVTGKYLSQYVDRKGRRWIASSGMALRRTPRLSEAWRRETGWNDPHGYNNAMDQVERTYARQSMPR